MRENFNEVQKEKKKEQSESRERLVYLLLPLSAYGDGEKREHLDYECTYHTRPEPLLICSILKQTSFKKNDNNN